MNNLKLNILDERIDILIEIANQIPFLEILLETLIVEKSNEVVVINEVSPKFFRILINFLKNQEKIHCFERDINIFEKKDIERWLKYLGMDVLMNKLYGRRYVGGKLVITDFVIMRDRFGRRIQTYKLYDGQFVTNIVCDNIVISVPGVKCKIDKNEYILIKTNFNTDVQKIGFLPIEDIIIDNGSYFITYKCAVEYNLIDDAKHTCPICPKPKKYCANSIFDKL